MDRQYVKCSDRAISTIENALVMLPFFNTGARPTKQEEAYYKRLIYLLEENGPSECLVKFKGGVGTIAGLFIGFVWGTLTGIMVCGFAGLVLGLLWANGHALLLAILKDLPDDKKVRAVGLVQGVVGGSSDVNDLEEFINTNGSNKLTKALEKNLKITII